MIAYYSATRWENASRPAYRAPDPSSDFYTQEPVVLGDPLRAGRGPRLDLTRTRGYGKIGDGRVLGLAGSVADYRSPTGLLGHCHHLKGLGQGADLVGLYEDGVACFSLDAPAQALGVGDVEVVPDNLHPLPRP